MHDRQFSRGSGQGFSQRPARSRFAGNSGGRSRPSYSRFQNNRKSFDPSLLVRKATNEVEETFVPQHAFSDFALCEQLQRNIVRRGYTTLTPIQDQAIPQLLEGRDVVGLANTGTGKTAAFLIPLIQKVFADHTQRVLIVAPTRELAVQIEQELKLFSQGMQIFSALCIGGVKIYPQISKLHRRPQFVIGTPGRLRDLEEQRALNFNHFNNIVLDEVDQMLNMGFIREVQYIASLLPTPRQSLFFSATLPDTLQSIMRQFLNNPVKISVKSRDTAANIDQDVVRTNGKQKLDVLHDMLVQEEFEKVIVFLRTKHATEKLARALDERGFRVGSIHGNKNQNQRQRTIEMFKHNRIRILIATDVASRGLDIDNVSHVINFDLPETYEDYVHRIGRTGRASKKGIALTFVD
jgi:ATP-dependent RNA helicase RhlE